MKSFTWFQIYINADMEVANNANINSCRNYMSIKSLIGARKNY